MTLAVLSLPVVRNEVIRLIAVLLQQLLVLIVHLTVPSTVLIPPILLEIAFLLQAVAELTTAKAVHLGRVILQLIVTFPRRT